MIDVIMKTLAAGPDGTFYPGKKRSVTKQEAKALVDGGFASYVNAPEDEENQDETEFGESDDTETGTGDLEDTDQESDDTETGNKKRGRKPKK